MKNFIALALLVPWLALAGGNTQKITASAPLVLSAGVMSIPAATGLVNGYLSSTDWTTFNSKQTALTLGNITTSTSGISITGGTGSIVGSGVAVNIQTASGSQPGLLSAADWTTFNSKLSSTDPTVTGVLTMGSASGADIYLATAGAGNLGVAAGQASGTDRRLNNAFLRGTLIVGNVLNVSPPYGLNNPAMAGIIGSGNNTANVGAIMGATSILNSTAQGFHAFAKDGSFSNVPGFFNLNDSGANFDIYYAVAHVGSTRTDLIKFGGDGTLNMMKSSGANLLWTTDGAGSIGAAGANRPDSIYTKTAAVANGYHMEASEVDDGNSGTADTIDWSTGSAHKSTLTGNVTYTFSNPVTGASYVLRIATGAGGFSMGWPGTVTWLNTGNTGPGVDSVGSKTCVAGFYYDGTTYWGNYACTY